MIIRIDGLRRFGRRTLDEVQKQSRKKHLNKCFTQ